MRPATHSPHRRSHRSALALVAVGAAAALGACKRPAQNAQAPAVSAEARGPVRVTTAPAAGRTLPSTLSATGTLVPDQQSQLTPIVSGRVVEVLVERGATVREGQPLIRLRDVDYRAQAATAQAAMSQARARLGLGQSGQAGSFNPESTADVRAAAANRDLADDAQRRAEQLHQTGAMSDAEYQRAAAQATAAREQYQSALNGTRAAWYAYQQAREAVSTANRAVSDSVVRAPFAGEIAERSVSVGEYVTPQRAVVTLVRTDPLRMEIQIPQERIAQVRRDQPVEVRVDAFPDRVFRGTVRYISAAVRADTRSLVAEAVVPNEDGTLRPGLFATARIDLGAPRQAVEVPARAVASEAGAHRVYVIANNRAQERVVTLGDRSGDRVVIERGVNPGEQVAVEGVDRLFDGAAVTQ